MPAADVISPEIVDDSGYRIRQRDLDFLSIAQEQVTDWAKRRVPLGMTLDSYRRFVEDLFTVLRGQGLTDADVRLQGSSARFFSYKQFPHLSTEWRWEFKRSWRRDPSNVELDEIARRHQRWFFDGDRPAQRPFDSMFRLSIHRDRSDIDVQLSSDRLAQRTEQAWAELQGSEYGIGSLTSKRYGFLNKTAVEFACRDLVEWAERYTDLLDRVVTLACFPRKGPERRSGRISSHFREGDWLVQLRTVAQ